jgi:hypothetical protein
MFKPLLRRHHRMVNVGIVFIAASLLGFALLGASAVSRRAPAPAASANLPASIGAFDVTSDAITQFPDFELYSLGDEFGGLTLSETARTLLPPPVDAQSMGVSNWTNSVSFIYGTCEVLEEGRCEPPLVVQVWPACDRALDDYWIAYGDGGQYRLKDPMIELKRTTMGEVPAALVIEGPESSRAELYTGAATVVIWSTLKDVNLDAIASQLRPANERAAASWTGRLPPPVDGALEGELSCGDRLAP